MRTDRSTPAPRAVTARLQDIWTWYLRLTRLSFPQRFPIVQFPNLPLIVAFLAGVTAMFLHGTGHTYATSVSYAGMIIWAYEELAHGVNWFRHCLGLAYTMIMVYRVAHAIHP